MKRFFKTCFFAVYFLLMRSCLPFFVKPHRVRIFHSRNTSSQDSFQVSLFFGELSDSQRRVIERQFRRFHFLLWGDWDFFFAADLPLLQQTLNLSWLEHHSELASFSGLSPSLRDEQHIEAAVFRFHQLQKNFKSALDPLETLRFLARVMSLDASEELRFIETQQAILAGEWKEIPPWKLALTLKEKPEIWCWWFIQFPFDWAELPVWNSTQEEVLFALARWEISRSLLRNWETLGFADELKRIEMFLEKSFSGNMRTPSPDFLHLQQQLKQAYSRQMS